MIYFIAETKEHCATQELYIFENAYERSKFCTKSDGCENGDYYQYEIEGFDALIEEVEKSRSYSRNMMNWVNTPTEFIENQGFYRD